MSLEGEPDYRVELQRIIGMRLKGIATLALVDSALISIFWPWKEDFDAGSAAFMHALRLEHAYIESIITFLDDGPPKFAHALPAPAPGDLERIFGVNRILCFIGYAESGRIAAVRGYDGVEVTELMEAQLHIARFIGQGNDPEAAIPHFYSQRHAINRH